MKNNTALLIENVSKKYTIGVHKNESFREAILNVFNKKKHDESREFWALKDINLEVEKGDVVGVIGKNGAGKSTLLKLLSQITKPSEGRIQINGRVASLLEVGTGFHQELTGRENIYLNGTILGMTRSEVKSKFDEIVAFSGIEKFIDTAVKNYSSGMYVRLAFAVAAHLEPEILIIDEVLAVGDSDFQKKCLGKMKDVAGQGRTVLFVSHQLTSIKQLCNKGVLLENGFLKAHGSIDEIINLYQSTSKTNNNNYKVESSKNDFFFKEINLLNVKNEFHQNETIQFEFKLGSNLNFDEGKMLLIRIMTNQEIKVFSCQTKVLSKKNEYILEFDSKILTKGEYKLNCIIYHPAIKQYDHVDGCCNFEIICNSEDYSHLDQFDIGLTNEESVWV